MAAPVLNVAMLDAEQLESAELIRRMFLAEGFSEWVAAAAIVNAFRESSLRPWEKSKSGKYVGLFMLSPDLMPSKWEREQADLNTNKIIEEALASKEFMRRKDGEDLTELVWAFGEFVERPYERKFEESQRVLRSLALYPDHLQPQRPVVPAAEAEAEEPFPWHYVWLGAALALGLYIGTRK